MTAYNETEDDNRAVVLRSIPSMNWLFLRRSILDPEHKHSVKALEQLKKDETPFITKLDILFPITKKVLVCLSEALRVNKSLKHLYFYTNAGLEMIPTLRWKEFCKSLKGSCVTNLYLSDWDIGVGLDVIESLSDVIGNATSIQELAIEVEWSEMSQTILTNALCKNESITTLVLKQLPIPETSFKLKNMAKILRGNKSIRKVVFTIENKNHVVEALRTSNETVTEMIFCGITDRLKDELTSRIGVYLARNKRKFQTYKFGLREAVSKAAESYDIGLPFDLETVIYKYLFDE